jgi:hypothetical protein
VRTLRQLPILAAALAAAALAAPVAAADAQLAGVPTTPRVRRPRPDGAAVSPDSATRAAQTSAQTPEQQRTRLDIQAWVDSAAGRAGADAARADPAARAVPGGRRSSPRRRSPTRCGRRRPAPRAARPPPSAPAAPAAPPPGRARDRRGRGASPLRVTAPVRAALDAGRAVVLLESSVLAQGFPSRPTARPPSA